MLLMSARGEEPVGSHPIAGQQSADGCSPTPTPLRRARRRPCFRVGACWGEQTCGVTNVAPNNGRADLKTCCEFGEGLAFVQVVTFSVRDDKSRAAR